MVLASLVLGCSLVSALFYVLAQVLELRTVGQFFKAGVASCSYLAFGYFFRGPELVDRSYAGRFDGSRDFRSFILMIRLFAWPGRFMAECFADAFCLLLGDLLGTTRRA